jgi:hypothetical protein
LVYHEGEAVKGCIVLLPNSSVAPLDDPDSAADGAGTQFQVLLCFVTEFGICFHHGAGECVALRSQIMSTASHKTYLMKAHSEAERKAWLDTLNDVISQLSTVARLGV